MSIPEVLREIAGTKHIKNIYDRLWLWQCRTHHSRDKVLAAIIRKANEFFEKETTTFGGSLFLYESFHQLGGKQWRRDICLRAARKAITQATTVDQLEELFKAVKQKDVRIEILRKWLELAKTTHEYWVLAVAAKKASYEVWEAAVKACALKLAE